MGCIEAVIKLFCEYNGFFNVGKNPLSNTSRRSNAHLCIECNGVGDDVRFDTLKKIFSPCRDFFVPNHTLTKVVQASLILRNIIRKSIL